jgi:GTP-binding protein YchF
VVRAFETNSVVHLEDDLDPRRDIETIETELAIADLETIEKRLPRLEKEARIDRALQTHVDLLTELRDVVAAGEMVARKPKLMVRQAEFADLHLLTAKPVIYVFNSDEWLLADPGRRRALAQMVAPSKAIFLDAQIEAELTELEPEERVEMLTALGQDEPGLDAVIDAAYQTLGLQSYLTGGEKESRAWTIRTDSTAPEAAGVIHTDFERGFIAAEVVDYDTLIEAGSWAAARSNGLVRTEGRHYVMKANDVVEFRFNV